MTEHAQSLPIVVGMTGATGAIYGIRVLEILREVGVETHLVVSRWADVTILAETDRKPAEVRTLATYTYEEDDVSSPLADASLQTAGMIVAPCSMRTLAAVANGFSDNLVQRAAELHLQERRKLVLLVRESPLSVIHLDNMLRVAKAGPSIATDQASRSAASWRCQAATTSVGSPDSITKEIPLVTGIPAWSSDSTESTSSSKQSSSTAGATSSARVAPRTYSTARGAT